MLGSLMRLSLATVYDPGGAVIVVAIVGQTAATIRATTGEESTPKVDGADKSQP